MTVSITTIKVQYNGDGATTTFPITFPFSLVPDVRVLLNSTVWVEGTHYTISGTTLTTLAGYTPAVGQVLTIKRAAPNTQPSAFPLGGSLPSTRLESAIDRVCELVQQNTEGVGRSMALAESDTSGASTVLPVPVALKTFRWDAAGTALEQTDDPAVSAVAAATSATNAATSATNAATSATNAATSETNAATSATNAATSATNAATSATNAATSETNAATSETNAAAYAAQLTGTSTTSVAIATGSKAFTTQGGKFFAVGAWLLVTSDANTANYMHGQATAYNTGTGALTVNVTDIGGAGTLADWTIRLSATRGAIGATGATGPTGPVGMVWKGAWVTTTAYVVDDVVYEAGSSYICLVAHTSGTFATDLGAGKWSLVAKAGTGDVVGPAASTDKSVVLFDGITGKLIKDGIAPGASGNLLTSDGTNWTSAAGGGGAWAVKSSGTFTSVTNVDFTSITKTTKLFLLATYDAGLGGNLTIVTSSDGGATWDVGASDYQFVSTKNFVAATGVTSVSSSGFPYLPIINGTPDISTPVYSEILLYEPANTGVQTHFSHKTTMINTGDVYIFDGVGTRVATAAINAFRIIDQAGVAFTGSYVLLELN